jgi:hypothetical protein
MKHWQLREHSDYCKQAHNQSSFNYCERNPEQILFYSQGDYYLLTINSCLFGANKYDSIVEIFNKIGSLKKKTRLNEFKKITDVDRMFKDFRLRDMVFSDIHHEVNYVYYNNGGKEYNITSKVNLFDAIEWRENKSFYNNYKEMESYLISIGLDLMLPQLKNLMYSNTFNNPSKKEVVITIDNILDKIQKQINN